MRSFSPGCQPMCQADGVRRSLALGAGVQAWGPGMGPLPCVLCRTLRAAGVAEAAREGAPLAVLTGVRGYPPFLS